MGKFKVVQTDFAFGNTTIEDECYKKAGYDYVVIKSGNIDEIKEAVKDADAVTCSYTEMNADMMDAFTKCKVIVRAGIGVNNVDIPEATKRGIMVANVLHYCKDEVSDHAIALAMGMIRKTCYMDRRVRNGLWEGAAPARPIPRINTLWFCTYGFGNIARKMAPKIKAIGFKVAAYDPYVDDSVFEEYGVERIKDESEVLKRADVLSIMCCLNDETRGIINKEKFALMKPSAILINTARGGIINEPDLIEALQTGVIGGAGLDVVVDETPDMNSPLFKLENTIFTPHIAYYSVASDIDLRYGVCRQVVDALEKGEPEFFVNKTEMGR